MSGDAKETIAYRWARRGLIAVGVLAVLGGVALAALIALSFWNGPRFEPAKVETADRRQVFTVGDITAIDRTRLVRLSVSEGQGNKNSYSYSYTRDDLRNVLILDTASGRSWRLLPSNDRRIADMAWLPAAATGPSTPTDLMTVAGAAVPDDERKPPDAYFLFQIDRAAGGYDLVAGTIDGRSRGTIMQRIDGLDSSWMRDADHLALIVREGGKLSYRIVDLKTYRTIRSQPIAIDR